MEKEEMLKEEMKNYFRLRKGSIMMGIILEDGIQIDKYI